MPRRTARHLHGTRGRALAEPARPQPAGAWPCGTHATYTRRATAVPARGGGRRPRSPDWNDVANRFSWIAAALSAVAVGCSNSPPQHLYEKVAVARRDLDVRVSAAGVIEPVLTVDVKSKASSEIIEMRVQNGDEVRAGELLARIDPRLQENTLAQAEANLEVARAQLQNAEAQKRRAEELFKSQSIAETEYETANLNHASARAAVVRAEAELETARDGME